MPAAPIIAIGASVIGAGAAVVGTAKSISAQNKMAKATKQQYAFERQMSQNRSVRERRDAIRAARIAGANLVQTGENSGASTSSAVLGGMGSIQSQLNSNLSFLDTQGRLADKGSAAGQVAADQKRAAQNWGAISDLGMAIFDRSDSIAAKFK